MIKKQVHKHSVSPEYHRVAWAPKRTRRGTVFATEVITPSSSSATPKQLKKQPTPSVKKDSRDQTPDPGEGIKSAMSLPPIPAPEILAPKKRGKV